MGAIFEAFLFRDVFLNHRIVKLKTAIICLNRANLGATMVVVKTLAIMTISFYTLVIVTMKTPVIMTISIKTLGIITLVIATLMSFKRVFL